MFKMKEQFKQDLKQAINKFNKKRRELISLGREVVPNKVLYSEISRDIYNKRQLDTTINSLNRFLRRGAGSVYITDAGEKITLWERKELAIKSRIAQNRINRELQNTALSKDEILELKLQKKAVSLSSLELNINKYFSNTISAIKNQGRSDYNDKKTQMFYNTYLKEMQKYNGLDNYDEFMKKLKNMSPEQFWNKIGNDTMLKDLTLQSHTNYAQAEFNKFIMDFDVKLSEEDIAEVKGLEEDNFSFLEDEELGG